MQHASRAIGKPASVEHILAALVGLICPELPDRLQIELIWWKAVTDSDSWLVVIYCLACRLREAPCSLSTRVETSMEEFAEKHPEGFHLGVRQKFTALVRCNADFGDLHPLWRQLNAVRPILDKPEQLEAYPLV